MSLLDLRSVNQVDVYEKGEKIGVLEQKELEKVVFSGDIYSEIGEYV